MTYTADPGTTIGHTHLKVSDLEQSIAFYRDVIGLEVQQRYGHDAAFMSAGGYHHHLGLNTWRSRGGPRPAPNATGLFHVAFLYPTRKALAQAVANVLGHGVTLTGAADHGVSQALYLDDPDGNGIELYWDRAPQDWPRDPDGNLAMVNDRLDINALLKEA
ncbi:VOC family protein [Gymnodinialimonas hymeniacidonis]|uniref:VOC family protein n=1 Tax=Gymnodinialimonas hymeniacidonis TaxID=3126508 RepID=UPI0034C60947